MSTPIHPPGSIGAERPVPVPVGDVKPSSVDMESPVSKPLIYSEELPSVEIYLENSDDDSGDNSDEKTILRTLEDEEVKSFHVRIIKMTQKQAEDTY
jgi:hypothetical protein